MTYESSTLIARFTHDAAFYDMNSRLNNLLANKNPDKFLTYYELSREYATKTDTIKLLATSVLHSDDYLNFRHEYLTLSTKLLNQQLEAMSIPTVEE
jgi:hypothetical protein